MSKEPRKLFQVLLFTACVIAGCAKLKQCAYQGVGRDQWQQPENVIATLQIRPGDQVADLGSGGGYFTFRLAQAVGPTGKVYAVDIDKEMIDLIDARVKKDSLQNVITLLAKTDDPLLPQGVVDLILTVNTFHHIDNRIGYFAKLRQYLTPGGRIAIIDYDRRAWFEGLFSHYTPSEFIQREMEQAGYALQNDLTFLDRQSFMIFATKR